MCTFLSPKCVLQARMKQLVLDEVKAYFRPELLNRFDEQIVFHKLGLNEVRAERDIVIPDHYASRHLPSGDAVQSQPSMWRPVV